MKKLRDGKQPNRALRPYEFAWERTVLIFTGCILMQFFPWLPLYLSYVFPQGDCGSLGLKILYTTIFIRIMRGFLYTGPTNDPRRDKRRVQWFFVTENGFVHICFVMGVVQSTAAVAMLFDETKPNFIMLNCAIFALCATFLCVFFIILAQVNLKQNCVKMRPLENLILVAIAAIVNL